MANPDKVKKPGRGLAFFLLVSLPPVLLISAAAAFAGFPVLVPFLNYGAAALAGGANAGFTALAGKKSRLSPKTRRIAAAAVCLLGSYLFVCATMGTVSAMFGPAALNMEEMRDFGLSGYLENAGNILGNTVKYLLLPGLLMSDIVGRLDETWSVLCVLAPFLQIGIPQLLPFEEKNI